jgi:hypothetical protein
MSQAESPGFAWDAGKILYGLDLGKKRFHRLRRVQDDFQIEEIVLTDDEGALGPACEQGDEIRGKHLFQFHGPFVFEVGDHGISFSSMNKAIGMPD